MNFVDMFSQIEIENDNPWKNTPYENYYLLTPRKKGSFAEKAISCLLTELNYNVQNPVNTGHDRIVNGYKTEIKFGLTTNKNNNWETIFNHISINKDWEKILFCCINGDLSVRVVQFSRDNLPQILLKNQQGGKQIQNDDFMINGNKTTQLMFDEKAEVIWIS